MKTRMERYYQTDDEQTLDDVKPKHSFQNKPLYEELPNIETTIDEKKIDLTRLENIIREEEKPKRDYQNILKINEQMQEDLSELEKELDKTFDINKIITRVKEECEGQTREGKHLYNTQYEIMSNVTVEVEEDIEEDVKPEEKLQELFHTITTNSLLSKDVATSELAFDVLSDLKPTDDEQEVVEGVKEKTQDTAPFVLGDAKPLQEIANINGRSKEENNDTREQAKEFFTGNISIKDNDFEDFSDLENAMQSSNKLIWILLILLLVVLAGLGYYVYTNLM